MKAYDSLLPWWKSMALNWEFLILFFFFSVLRSQWKYVSVRKASTVCAVNVCEHEEIKKKDTESKQDSSQ